jgi:phenylacetate-CoA ligase
MKICFVADARSPIAQNWINYFARREEVHVITSFPCAPDAIEGATIHNMFSDWTKLAGPARSSVRLASLTGKIADQLRSEKFGGLGTALQMYASAAEVPRQAWRIRKLLRSIRPDFVHAMRLPFEGIAAAFGTDDSVPLMVSIWGNDFTLHASGRPLIAALSRRALGRVDALHTDCLRDLRLAERWGFHSARPTIVVPGGGGVHLDRFRRSSGDAGLRGQLGIPPDAPVVLNARGFRGYVRNDTFFRSIPLVLAKNPAAVFVCVGMAGNAVAEQWVSSLGIGSAVRLLPGYAHDAMADLYSCADVAVSPSLHDGTPNTLLETMACGAFPVCGDIESIREWIEHGVNGYLVDPTDPDSVARGVNDALGDPALRQSAARRNRKLVEKKADYSLVMREAERFYELVRNRRKAFALTRKAKIANDRAEWLYPELPVPLQNAVCWYWARNERNTRFNREFEQTLEELISTERWSAAEIEAYQDEKLQMLIKHSYENVPYYRSLMHELRLTPADIRSRKDLPKLPLLTKETVRENLYRLVSERASPGDLVFRHTSGTTGKSLQFFVSRWTTPMQWAIWWRHRHRFGISPGTWHANFTGKMVVPPQQAKPPYWRWLSPMHQAVINMQHVTPAKVGSIVKFLDEQAFEFFSGYPSIIHSLCMASVEAGCKMKNPPRLIFTGAENVLAFQRRDIQAFTGAHIADQYGFSEACGNASQCEAGMYHEDFEFGIVETIDATTDSTGTRHGKIVCTGFASPEFPFIRYEVGDASIEDANPQLCSCGLHSRIFRGIEGRTDDYVITPEGLRIMRFDYLFKDTSSIRECQIVQNKPGEIRMRIVRRPEYSIEDERTIAREVAVWISPTIQVKFEYVNRIERSRTGKFRAVVSNLPKFHEEINAVGAP